MIYIFLSACCSVTVSVFLKLARRYQIDIYQAITWNYSIAIILTWLFYRPHISSLSSAPAYIYSGLGILLPLLFVVLGMAVRFTGIVRTDIAQRLSLLIPLIASFLLFKEGLSTIKVIGLLIGLAAILCLVLRPGRHTLQRSFKHAWIYLVIVFVGMGVIDVLFKQMAAVQGLSFTASLFIVYVLAFVISLIGLIYMVSTRRIKFTLRHIGFGWILGVANFGNILFYLRAHQVLANSPSTVFAAMNIGVIALGAITGLVIFRERLSTLNKAGILLAIAAVVILTYSQIH